METFSALRAIYAGNSPVPVNNPRKGQWRGALMFSWICAWINGWVNNREAGDLIRHRAHYDIIVMPNIHTALLCFVLLGWSMVLQNSSVVFVHIMEVCCIRTGALVWLFQRHYNDVIMSTISFRSIHQPHDCLLKRLFGWRSKKTSKLPVTGLCAGIHRWPVNSPHKGPVTRKMFPFDDVSMW